MGFLFLLPRVDFSLRCIAGEYR